MNVISIFLEQIFKVFSGRARSIPQIILPSLPGSLTTHYLCQVFFGGGITFVKHNLFIWELMW